MSQKYLHMIKEGSNGKFIFCYKYYDHHVKWALKIVDKVSSGKLGIAYNMVNKYYTSEASKYLNAIELLKLERMSPEISNDQACQITDKIKDLKKVADKFILFDKEAKRQLTNNYNRVKKALDILIDSDIVIAYTMRPSLNLLTIKWHEDFIGEQFPAEIKQNQFDPWFKYYIKKSDKQIKQEYLNDICFCGIMTYKEVRLRKKDRDTKLSKDQREQARRGVSITHNTRR